MLTKDHKIRKSRPQAHSPPNPRSSKQQRQEENQALSNYLEAKDALKSFLRVHRDQLPPERERLDNVFVPIRNEQEILEYFLEDYGNPFHALQKLPKETPIPLRKKITSLVLCFAVVLAQLIGGNVLLLPLALGLLSRIQTTTATAVESSAAIPLVNNPYGGNQVARRIKPPQSLIGECHQATNFFYRSRIAKPKTNPKTIFCIRTATAPQLTEEIFKTAAEDISSILRNNKGEISYNQKVYNILAKFPVDENVRLNVLQKAYDLLSLTDDFPEKEFLVNPGSLTNKPYHFDEVSSEEWMKQAEESQDVAQVAELLSIGVPPSSESKLPFGKSIIILNVLLQTANKNTIAIDLLLDSKLPINIMDMEFNPLYQVVISRNLPAIERLLLAGANPFTEDEYALSPYKQAVKIGDRDILKMLLRDIDFPGENRFLVAYNQLCLLKIVDDENLQQDIYKILAEFTKFNLREHDSNGNNLLHTLLTEKHILLESKKSLLKIIGLFAPELIAAKNNDGLDPLQKVESILALENSGQRARKHNKHYDNSETLRLILPELQTMMANYRRYHSKPNWLNLIMSSLGVILASIFSLSFIAILIIQFFKKKPKESFIVRGIYCQLTFEKIAKHEYRWQLEFLPRDQVCERHKVLPSIPLRCLDITNEDLARDITEFFNSKGNSNTYISTKDLASLRSTTEHDLFTIERQLIINTQIYRQTRSSNLSTKNLDKKITKIEQIIENYLYFINELFSDKNGAFLPPTIYVQSQKTESIIEEILELTHEAQKSLGIFKERVLDVSELFSQIHKEDPWSKDFKKMGRILWQKLEAISADELENLKNKTNDLRQQRSLYNLEIERCLSDLKLKLEKEVLKLRNNKQRTPYREEGVVVVTHSKNPVKWEIIADSPTVTNKESPTTSRPSKVVASTGSLQNFFHKFGRAKPYYDVQPIKVSYEPNTQLISWINIHLPALVKLNANCRDCDPKQKMIYFYEMKYHFFQIAHCSYLIKKKTSEIQIAEDDNTDKELRYLLGHHGYLLEDPDEILASTEQLIASLGSSIPGKKLITFANLTLHGRSKQIYKNDDTRSLVELKKTMVTLLHRIVDLTAYITTNSLNRCNESLKMLIMEFAEANRCLRRYHISSWKNGLANKINCYSQLDRRLNRLLQAVRHSHEKEDFEYTENDLNTLIGQILIVHQNFNFEKCIDEVDQHKIHLSL